MCEEMCRLRGGVELLIVSVARERGEGGDSGCERGEEIGKRREKKRRLRERREEREKTSNGNRSGAFVHNGERGEGRISE